MLTQETTKNRRRQITPTSLAVIETIYRYRYITSSQLHRLIGCDRRNLDYHLQALAEIHQLISRMPLINPATGYREEYVYFLESPRALELLCEYGKRQPDELDFDRFTHGQNEASEGRHQFLRHELMISRFHAMLELACNASGGEVLLADFKQGAELHSRVSVPTLKVRTQVIERRPQKVLYEVGEKETIPHWPDAFFTLEFPDRIGPQQYSHFFYEADRSTMDTTRMKKKLRGHFHFIVKQKLHHIRYNVESIRAVLTETISEAWAETLRHAASDPIVSGPKPSNLFWFVPSNFFMQPVTVKQGSRIKTIPYYYEHPEVIFSPLWFSPNDRAGDRPRSILDF